MYNRKVLRKLDEAVDEAFDQLVVLANSFLAIVNTKKSITKLSANEVITRTFCKQLLTLAYNEGQDSDEESSSEQASSSESSGDESEIIVSGKPKRKTRKNKNSYNNFQNPLDIENGTAVLGTDLLNSAKASILDQVGQTALRMDPMIDNVINQRRAASQKQQPKSKHTTQFTLEDGSEGKNPSKSSRDVKFTDQGEIILEEIILSDNENASPGQTETINEVISEEVLEEVILDQQPSQTTKVKSDVSPPKPRYDGLNADLIAIKDCSAWIHKQQQPYVTKSIFPKIEPKDLFGKMPEEPAKPQFETPDGDPPVVNILFFMTPEERRKMFEGWTILATRKIDKLHPGVLPDEREKLVFAELDEMLDQYIKANPLKGSDSKKNNAEFPPVQV
jgi:hypothetical protein